MTSCSLLVRIINVWRRDRHLDLPSTALLMVVDEFTMQLPRLTLLPRGKPRPLLSQRLL